MYFKQNVHQKHSLSNVSYRRRNWPDLRKTDNCWNKQAYKTSTEILATIKPSDIPKRVIKPWQLPKSAVDFQNTMWLNWYFVMVVIKFIRHINTVKLEPVNTFFCIGKTGPIEEKTGKCQNWHLPKGATKLWQPPKLADLPNWYLVMVGIKSSRHSKQ